MRFLPRFVSAVSAVISVSTLGGAQAQQAADQDFSGDNNIVVFGRSQTRQAQSLKQIDLSEAAPGTSPLEVLNKLPGVNFQSADTFGAYEWSARITLRGFNQNQLGFTLDDVPLGDMSYANFNGLHISRAVINENIRSTILSQGAGALETASTNNLGGTIQFYSVDPADAFGVTLAQGFGSDSARRSFIKIDSGRFSTGTKFYVSYVNQNSDKWKGTGEHRQEQANGKLIQQINEDSQFSAFVNYSDRREIDYQDLSKEYIAKLGYNWDNYYPNWQYAIDSARGIYHLGENTTSDALDAAYYAGSGLRTDVLAGGTFDLALTDDVRVKATAYHHSDDGRGLWYTPYTPSPSGSPVSLRTTEYGIDRNGVVANVTANFGMHHIDAGVWYEHNDFDQARRFYGLGIAAPGRAPYDFPNGAFFTQWQYQFGTDTVQFHLQDTVSITDALTVNVGFKSPTVDIENKTLAGPNLDGKISASKDFLPQVGITYALSQDNELFFNFAQNMRAFQAGATGTSPFATTLAGFNAIKSTLKPETSTTYETGWRYRDDLLETQVTLHHVDFYDRLLAIQQGPGIVGNPVILANVGQVVTSGAEAGVSLHPIEHWNWLNSVSYNMSQYDDNYVTNGVLVPTKGKQVVDSPRWMLKSELSYDDGTFYGHIGMDYFAKRYYTYLNDNYAGAYAIWNLGAGYRIDEPFRFMRELTLQVNVNNLLDRRYISTVGSNGFINSDPNGTNQTLLVGAPRSVFANVTARF